MEKIEESVEKVEGEFEKIEEKAKKQEVKDILDILKLFSPGTSMRTAIDDIVRARMGALIVIDKEGLSGIFEGGFRINCKFSAQRLVELAKMDGAIILSNDFKKILFVNTLLVPKILNTNETGTRHKAAERTSKQINTIVVAISERKNKTTIYYGDQKHILEESSEILRRATETLQILEKQKEIFNDLLLHLNILEVTNLATAHDVCSVLQRMEMVRRIADNVRTYLVGLGKEGIIVSMRLKELTRGLNSEREFILKDYFGNRALKSKVALENMNFDFLLETPNLLRILFEEFHDKSVSPKGFRILSKTDLLEKDIKLLVVYFRSLDKVFEASKEDLETILKRKGSIDSLKYALENLKEKILEGKNV